MKDALGHGSNGRGGQRNVVQEQNAIRRGIDERHFPTRPAASAVRAPAYDGKPTWHGVANGEKVRNSGGNPIAYASREAALAGGELHIQSLADKHGVDTSHLGLREGMHRMLSGPGGEAKRLSLGLSDEYNRDLALRMRNGQVGSGMKFRG